MMCCHMGEAKVDHEKTRLARLKCLYFKILKEGFKPVKVVQDGDRYRVRIYSHMFELVDDILLEPKYDRKRHGRS